MVNANDNESLERPLTSRAPTSKLSVVRRDVAGEAFLVPIHAHIADLQELFVLNDVGRYLWERLDGRSTVDDLVAAVIAEFEVGEDQARRDAEVFLAQLAQADLLEDEQTLG
jgi:hypothetical protein